MWMLHSLRKLNLEEEKDVDLQEVKIILHLNSVLAPKQNATSTILMVEDVTVGDSVMVFE